MTEFKDLDLNKEIADMEDEEAKKTLSEFMEAHQKNREAYNSLQTTLEDTEAEYQEKLDQKAERIAEFREQRAEKAADYVNMPAELIADKFSIDEIDQMISEAEEAGVDEEFSEETDEVDEEDTDENLTTFADTGEKGVRESSGGSSYSRDRAESKIKQHW